MLDITEMIIRARVRTVDNENDTHVLHVLIGPSIYKQSMYGEYWTIFQCSTYGSSPILAKLPVRTPSAFQ